MALDGGKLPVMEAFYTIQGEGFYQGESAYFIRLAGCDVGCFWCDVKESWDTEKHPFVDVDQLVAAVQTTPARIVVVTGGEPLMHDLTSLTKALHIAGIRTHLETSGSHPLSGQWDWICLSPKKFKPPVNEIMQSASELKIIIYNKSDFTWAETYGKKVSPECKLFLQPEWSKSKEVIPTIVEYIKANPKWQLSLQIHKYINVP